VVSDRDRGAVALLCLFAIVIAAAQFPAIGLGSAPDGGGPIGTPPSTDAAASDGDAGDADPGDSDDGDGTAGTGTATETTTERTTRSTDTPTTEDDDVYTDSRAGTDTPTRPATATERSTPEPTTERTTDGPADDETVDASSDDDSEDLGAVLGGILIVVAGALVLGVVALSGGMTRSGGGSRDRGTGQSKIAATLFGYLPRITAGLTGAIGRLPRRTMGFVIGASRSTPRLFDALGSATGQLFTGLRFAGSGAARAFGSVALQAPGGLAKGLGSLGRAAAGGLLSAPSGAGSLLGSLLSDETSSTDRPGADARNAADVDPEEPSEPDLPPPASVEEAWERMVEAAPVPGWQSKTPVEVAKDAVRTGLPVDPVGRLTELFRRVRYDPERPGDGALSGAREALARIEDVERSDGGETDE